MAVVLENRPRTRGRKKLKIPRDYKVILLNDDYTTMDFVVEVLVEIFRKPPEEAERVMLQVHRQGRGVAGIYPWDIARTKVIQVRQLAQEQDFPLRCVLEEA